MSALLWCAFAKTKRLTYHSGLLALFSFASAALVQCPSSYLQVTVPTSVDVSVCREQCFPPEHRHFRQCTPAEQCFPLDACQPGLSSLSEFVSLSLVRTLAPAFGVSWYVPSGLRLVSGCSSSVGKEAKPRWTSMATGCVYCLLWSPPNSLVVGVRGGVVWDHGVGQHRQHERPATSQEAPHRPFSAATFAGNANRVLPPMVVADLDV